MKLRIARKIYKAVDSNGNSRHSQRQISRALRRYAKTISSRDAEAWWDQFMSEITPDDRAWILEKSGMHTEAFRVLCEQGEGIPFTAFSDSVESDSVEP